VTDEGEKHEVDVPNSKETILNILQDKTLLRNEVSEVLRSGFNNIQKTTPDIQSMRLRTGKVFKSDEVLLESGHSIIKTLTMSNTHTLASGGSDGTIKLWNIETGTLIRTISTESGELLAIAFGSEGKRIYSCAYLNKSAYCWDTSTSKPLWQKEIATSSSWINTLAVSPDRSQLATGGVTDPILVWDAHTHELILDLTSPAIISTRCIAFANLSPLLVGMIEGNFNGRIVLWNLKSGNRIWEVDAGHQTTGVCFIKEDSCIAVLDSHTLSILSAFDGNLIWRTPFGTSPDPGYALDYNGKLNMIVTGHENNIIYLWDADTGNLVDACNGHSLSTFSVKFSLDGRYLASSGDDSRIKLWRL